MAFALWPRPCRNCCGAKRQPGCISNLTRCSRPYVRGGKDLDSDASDDLKLEDLGKNGGGLACAAVVLLMRVMGSNGRRLDFLGLTGTMLGNGKARLLADALNALLPAIRQPRPRPSSSYRSLCPKRCGAS